MDPNETSAVQFGQLSHWLGTPDDANLLTVRLQSETEKNHECEKVIRIGNLK
jgi:hypothetical protein